MHETVIFSKITDDSAESITKNHRESTITNYVLEESENLLSRHSPGNNAKICQNANICKESSEFQNVTQLDSTV